MKIKKGHATPDGAELEKLLALAVDEPGRRPAFYRKLMESDVLALVPDDVVATNPQGDEVIRFVQWKRIDDQMAIPFFTSARTLFEAVPQGAQCLVLDGFTFFMLTRGALLHLNPFSHYNVEITHAEVDALLKGGSVVSPERVTNSSPKTLTVRDVPEPPLAMIEALTILYSQAPNIKAAYLALVTGMYDTGQDSLLLGLELQGDPESIVNDTSAVIRDTYAGAFSIDVMRVPLGDSGENPFRPSQSFFDRRMAALLHAPSITGNA